ncbi:hypothetical protein [Photobacterium chitinilyticum]|uniref:Uncharacterized protein n=1 Tax=Photobacterium chitinilyticum TaxID=2485123 RepID=A0A3S3QR72_9GAMM|nr:hypothetical protein [Photobacterium chitinilyticum]RWX53978.1 hypothetical protein EDI28_18750 [Photobacterium chitinilyticum]
MSKFYPGSEPGRRRRTLQRRLRGALTYQTLANGNASPSEMLTAHHRHRSGNERDNLTPNPHHSLATIACLQTL